MCLLLFQPLISVQVYYRIYAFAEILADIRSLEK